MFQSSKITSLHLAAMTLCLFPIWYNQFPPMQDYPLHLFLSHTLATFNDPQFNWGENYIQNPRFTPYSITHYFIAFLSEYINIQLSGKIAISIYVLLIGFVSLNHRNKQTKSTLWPGILIFPLIFNQAYYLGFLNFLISIPILIISLQQHIATARDWPTKPHTLTHLTTLTILFFIHPYTLVVYMVSSLFLQLTARNRIGIENHYSPVPALCLLFFVVWLMSNSSPDNLLTKEHTNLIWRNPLGTLLFYFSFLTNNATLNPSTIAPYLCWSTILITITLVIRKNIRTLLRTEFFQLFIITSIGFFVLPMAVSDYHNFNLRLAPISFFFLILSLYQLEFSKKQKIVLSLCALLLIAHTSYIHYMVSIEKEEVVPILNEIEPNAAIFPFYLDSSSAHINNLIYDELHSHDHNYYHILIGGGVSPNILPNKMFPILSRNSKSSLSQGLKDIDYLKRIAPIYKYLLIRHNNKQPGPELPIQFQSIKKNKTWELLINTSTNK